MIEEDFYATIKLVSNEEIFSLVSFSDEGDKKFLILDNPVIITPVTSKNGRVVGYKIIPWVNITDDEMFIIDFEKVITITEIKDQNVIGMYKKFNKKTNKLSLTKGMGLINKVEDARRILEKIYRDN